MQYQYSDRSSSGILSRQNIMHICYTPFVNLSRPKSKAMNRNAPIYFTPHSVWYKQKQKQNNINHIIYIISIITLLSKSHQRIRPRSNSIDFNLRAHVWMPFALEHQSLLLFQPSMQSVRHFHLTTIQYFDAFLSHLKLSRYTLFEWIYSKLAPRFVLYVNISSGHLINYLHKILTNVFI